MNCLCCGASLDPANAQERKDQWHSRCIRKLFGTKEMPEVELTAAKLQDILEKSIRFGYTVTGVQKKISLHLEQEDASTRLAVKDYLPGYILKPQQKGYAALPEAESLLMQMAGATGISTVPFGLLRMKDDGSLAYITRRVDRSFQTIRRARTIQMYAMEDFCQLSGRLTRDKYQGSYEQCARIISKYSEQPGLDLSEFFLRVVLSFAGGNSDMHLKNFSLLEKTPGSRRFALSPAYDLLPVNLVLPEDGEETALSLSGRKSKLRRSDFRKLAEKAGIPEKAARNLIDRVLSLEETYFSLIRASLLPSEMKEVYTELVRSRLRRLCQ